jgi:hypothetical protein
MLPVIALPASKDTICRKVNASSPHLIMQSLLMLVVASGTGIIKSAFNALVDGFSMKEKIVLLPQIFASLLTLLLELALPALKDMTSSRGFANSVHQTMPALLISDVELGTGKIRFA